MEYITCKTSLWTNHGTGNNWGKWILDDTMWKCKRRAQRGLDSKENKAAECTSKGSLIV